MHEYSKKIANAIKDHYSRIEEIDGENLVELCKWSEIVKNLTEYDKNIRIIEAMDEEENGRMGYNNRRYTNGRYAPRGRGRVMGYEDEHYPYLMYEDDDYMKAYLNDPNFMKNMKMGYTKDAIKMGDTRYGRSYNQYRDNRKFYQATHDEETKLKMKDNLSEVFNDMEDMVTDVWVDMTPDEKQKYKQKFTKLVEKMI